MLWGGTHLSQTILYLFITLLFIDDYLYPCLFLEPPNNLMNYQMLINVRHKTNHGTA
jgi:hypothetical protein